MYPTQYFVICVKLHYGLFLPTIVQLWSTPPQLRTFFISSKIVYILMQSCHTMQYLTVMRIYIPRICANSIFCRATWLIFSHIWWSVSDSLQGICCITTGSAWESGVAGHDFVEAGVLVHLEASGEERRKGRSKSMCYANRFYTGTRGWRLS